MTMRIFTIIIIAWVVYQLVVYFLKKSEQQSAKNFSGPYKIPTLESWQEQLKQASDKGPYRVGSFDLREPKRFEEIQNYYYGTEGTQGVEGTWGVEGIQGVEGTWGVEGTQGVEGIEGTEGTQGVEGIEGVEGTQGIEGIGNYVGILGQEAYKSAGAPLQEKNRGASGLSGVHCFSTQSGLAQAVIWAEILGKPRALRPFKGPRV